MRLDTVLVSDRVLTEADSVRCFSSTSERCFEASGTFGPASVLHSSGHLTSTFRSKGRAYSAWAPYKQGPPLSRNGSTRVRVAPYNLIGNTARRHLGPLHRDVRRAALLWPLQGHRWVRPQLCGLGHYTSGLLGNVRLGLLQRGASVLGDDDRARAGSCDRTSEHSVFSTQRLNIL
jgi:hypothetical protein